MFLFQLFIPVKPSRRHQHSRHELELLQLELTQKFGGVTVYAQSPAEGLWKNARHVTKDRIVVVEVMSMAKNLRWWKQYKRMLEARLDEDEIFVRYWTTQRV